MENRCFIISVSGSTIIGLVYMHPRQFSPRDRFGACVLVRHYLCTTIDNLKRAKVLDGIAQWCCLLAADRRRLAIGFAYCLSNLFDDLGMERYAGVERNDYPFGSSFIDSMAPTASDPFKSSSQKSVMRLSGSNKLGFRQPKPLPWLKISPCWQDLLALHRRGFAYKGQSLL
jgi:hypothetical protein